MDVLAVKEALSEQEKKVLEYINGYEAKGYTDDRIKEALLKSGVSEATVAKCMRFAKIPFYRRELFWVILAPLALLLLFLLIFLFLPQAECTKSADCGSGYACDSGSCVALQAECSVDSDCSSGEECHSGNCVVVSECSVDSDCSSGEECDSGSCVAVPAQISVCDYDADCGDGYTCDAGSCVEETVAAEPQCGDGDCTIGEDCALDCGCVDDSDCTVYGDYGCSSGVCYEISSSSSSSSGSGTTSSSSSCSSQTDCSSGYGCDTTSGNCYNSCTENVACATNYACNSYSLCSSDSDVNGVADVDEGLATFSILSACVDSDAGYDLSTQGFVTGTSYYSGEEVSGTAWTDFCSSGSQLVEYLCPGSGDPFEGYAYGEVVDCSAGEVCSDGACVSSVVQLCGGDAGCGAYLCDSATQSCYADCANGGAGLCASDAACSVDTSCISCVDSDGNDPSVKGTISGVDTLGASYLSVEESCASDTAVTEYTCVEELGHLFVGEETVSCSEGCVDGACLPECSVDADCPAGEICTYSGHLCSLDADGDTVADELEKECTDAVDNNGDGFVDYLGACDTNGDGVADVNCLGQDFRDPAECLDYCQTGLGGVYVLPDACCSGLKDSTEETSVLCGSDAECGAGYACTPAGDCLVDADADGLADEKELGCRDGDDNDGDGGIDYAGACDLVGSDGVADFNCLGAGFARAASCRSYCEALVSGSYISKDSACTSSIDRSESDVIECRSDLGCGEGYVCDVDSSSSTYRTCVSIPEDCSNGLDDDGDGLVDFDDSDCIGSETLCVNRGDCPSGESCGDVDGDGSLECLACIGDAFGGDISYGEATLSYGVTPASTDSSTGEILGGGVYTSIGDSCRSSTVVASSICISGVLFLTNLDCSDLGSVYTCVDGACVLPAEDCSNGIDDDGDGAVDSADGDCVVVAGACPETLPTCGDGVDNDGDGAVDLADVDCGNSWEGDEGVGVEAVMECPYTLSPGDYVYYDSFYVGYLGPTDDRMNAYIDLNGDVDDRGFSSTGTFQIGEGSSDPSYTLGALDGDDSVDLSVSYTVSECPSVTVTGAVERPSIYADLITCESATDCPDGFICESHFCYVPECNDGVDNDHDGGIDYVAFVRAAPSFGSGGSLSVSHGDSDCTDAFDNDERSYGENPSAAPEREEGLFTRFFRFLFGSRERS